MARRRRSIRRRVSRRRRRAAPTRRRSRARKALGRLRPKSAFNQMANLAGGLVFFSQLTQKDRDAGRYQGSMGDKAKIFINNIGGRIVGFQPFSDSANPAFKQTLNLDGAFNKFTAVGIASLIYGSLPLKMLPHRSKAKVLGKRIATAGFLGGIFDAPENDTRNRVVSQRPATASGIRVSASMPQQVATT